ncbi:aldo/keto reductase [Priestia sp. Y58]|uniref:aldo/keto reductase n=1 Tax=Priestia TaxID=2800373 RepID=UPI001C8DF4A7|nr:MULTISPECIES: aldo/keto reductase [Priestia]MBX9987278.1 aldo/keto reductase [Priestia aryabhattai]MBX9998849.1 aldo/keto reductase [Priestia aryabhattai]MDG0032091.1 aldo/keto reductase [Priestia sp. Y58]MDG0060093.1 aldo/keto reductase [Priestia sp. P5]UYV54740.1 aldo/keto reductase [Priestia megaterium]
MKFRKLKNTDITVSEIGLGTNAVGGHNLFNNLNEESGKELVAAAIDLGITFIDTADIYGMGRSEELVGEVLSNYNRDKFILATKGARRWFEDGRVEVDNSPAYLRQALENSLSRLKMDYVDLYYLHFPDNKTPLVEAIGELSKLKQEGKIKAIGISNVSLDQLKEANTHGDISVLQSAYNMLERSAEEDLLPYSRENNISFIPYGPLAFGLLGGKYTKDFQLTEGDWRQSNPLFEKENFDKVLEKVEQLKNIATTKETTVANLSLAWLLAQDGVDAVIPGGKRSDQIITNAKASDVLLTKDDLNNIEKILK